MLYSRIQRLTVKRSAICYCILAITRWLLTNRISLHLNSAGVRRMYITPVNRRLLDVPARRGFDLEISRAERRQNFDREKIIFSRNSKKI